LNSVRLFAVLTENCASLRGKAHRNYLKLLNGDAFIARVSLREWCARVVTESSWMVCSRCDWLCFARESLAQTASVSLDTSEPVKTPIG